MFTKYHERRSRDFSLSNFFDFLKDFELYDEDDMDIIFNNAFDSDTFKRWLFLPEEGPTVAEDAALFFGVCTIPRISRVILRVYKDMGYDYEYDRTLSVFMYQLALQLQEEAKTTKRAAVYENLADDIIREVRRSLKTDCNTIYRLFGGNLPQNTIFELIARIPDTKYIDKSRLPYYVTTTLTRMYEFLNETSQYMEKEDWRDLFITLFDKEMLNEISSLVLVEGTSRIKGMNSNRIRDNWNSLTDMALIILDNADPQIRDQMVEIYIKRVGSMVKNQKDELRIDLRTLNPVSYPNLSDTIEKYKGKLDDILEN